MQSQLRTQHETSQVQALVCVSTPSPKHLSSISRHIFAIIHVLASAYTRTYACACSHMHTHAHAQSVSAANRSSATNLFTRGCISPWTRRCWMASCSPSSRPTCATNTKSQLLLTQSSRSVERRARLCIDDYCVGSSKYGVCTHRHCPELTCPL